MPWVLTVQLGTDETLTLQIDSDQLAMELAEEIADGATSFSGRDERTGEAVWVDWSNAMAVSLKRARGEV